MLPRNPWMQLCEVASHRLGGIALSMQKTLTEWADGFGSWMQLCLQA